MELLIMGLSPLYFTEEQWFILNQCLFFGAKEGAD